eukprot:GHVU01049463.1.p1 GENE.GHVU01049463.1~~GHVU01049463.1.p1  ORF type:complete len:1045 (-),score=114.36 GHVU01049463.1:51-3185(-)
MSEVDTVGALHDDREVRVETLYKYIESIRHLTAVKRLEDLGDLAVLTNTASCLASDYDLTFYWNSLHTPGHPNAAPAKGEIRAALSTCTIIVFSLFITEGNHVVVCVVNLVERRLLALDPMPGIVPASTFTKLSDTIGAVFGWPQLRVEKPTMPTQADPANSSIFACLYIDFIIQSVHRGQWREQSFGEDTFWDAWDPKRAVEVQRRNIEKVIADAGRLDNYIENRSQWSTEAASRPLPLLSSPRSASFSPEEAIESPDDTDESSGEESVLVDAVQAFKCGVEDAAKKTYRCVNDALMALYKVFSLTCLTVASHGASPANNAGIMSCRHRCEQKGCPVSLTLRVNTATQETSIKILNLIHTHAPVKKKKMQKAIKRRWVEKMAALREEGMTHYRAYNHANVEMCAETGRSFEPREVSGLFRRAEQKRQYSNLLQKAAGAVALVEESSDEDRPLNIKRVKKMAFQPERDHEKEKVALFSVINLLRSKQESDPQLYINCVHKNDSLDYMFVSPRHQRISGRLFGEAVVIDDKHYVSEHGYQLMMISSVNSTGSMEAFAFALIRSSTTEWYAQVARDYKRATEVNEDIGRKFCVFFADQDSAISSGVAVVDNVVRRFRCFKHFMTNITKKHANDKCLFQPVFEGLNILLTQAKPWKFPAVEERIEKLIAAVPDEKKVLRDKLLDFFNEAKSRKLCDLSFFTNGWTSQSVAEAVFSATSKLNLRRSASVFDVVESLFEYFANRQQRSSVEDFHHNTGKLGAELTKTGRCVTSHAFKLFMDEYNEIREYDYKCCASTKYRVSRIGSIAEHRFHIVTSDNFSCTCRMGVWKGIPCRHALRVLHGVNKGYFHDPWMFAARWHRVQPQVTLTWRSPTVTVEEDVCGAVQGRDPRCEGPCAGTEKSSSSSSSSVAPLFISSFRGSSVEPDSAAEFNADLSQRFSGVMSHIGHDRSLLSQAASVVETFESAALGGSKEEGVLLPKQGVRNGRPQELRFKSRVLEARSNSKRIKPHGKCSRCGKVGHNIKGCPQLRERFGQIDDKPSFDLGSESE